MADRTRSYWWASLRHADDPVPASVAERLTWCEKQVRRQRTGSYILETAIVVTAAAIPVATTVRASLTVIGVLGGVVAVLTGLRQLLRPGENWIRSAGTLVALQREVVLWSAGRRPYDAGPATGKLIERTENLVAQETARWADQRAIQSTATTGSTQADSGTSPDATVSP